MGGGGGKWLQLLEEQIVIEFQKKENKKTETIVDFHPGLVNK